MSRTGAIRRLGALLVVVVAALSIHAFQVSAAPAKAAAPAKTAKTAASASKAAPAKGDAAKGKSIFMSKCIACHKANGTGGVKLTGNPTPNWTDAKTWADPKRKDVDAYLRNCITNGVTKSGMVAWGKTGQLKPAQIDDVIAFIKDFRPAEKNEKKK